MASPDRARHDVNLKPSLIAVSNADGESPVSLWADPITHALVTSGGGGGGGGADVQYGNGATVATPTGTVALGYDGSNVRALKTDSTGQLYIANAGSGGGVSAVDSATFTAGTSTFAPVGGVFNDSVTALTSGQQGTQRLTASRGAHVNLRNASGTELGIAATPLRVDPTGTTTQPVSVSGTVPVTESGTWNVGLNAGTNAIGSITNTSFAATQATAANLNATVIGTGTFATQVTSSALPTGAATSANQSTEIASLASIATNTVQIPSLVSTNNSSTTVLTSGSAFTGSSEDVTNYSEMRVSVFSDVASATDGLSLQQSTNGTNWDVIDTYTIPASTGKTFVVPRQEKFFRIVYTNGVTNQTAFRLQTILNRTGTAPSSNRASDGYTNETDLVQNQTFTMVYNGTTWDRLRGDSTNGAYVQVKTSVSPALPSTIVNGQKAVTTTASALTSGTLTQGVIIESLSTNTVSVFVGGSGVTATTGIELLPGGSTSVAVNNTSLINVITASGTATVTYIGS